MGQAFHVNHTPQFTQLDQCNYQGSHVFQGNAMFLADLFQMVLRLTIGTETRYLSSDSQVFFFGWFASGFATLLDVSTGRFQFRTVPTSRKPPCQPLHCEAPIHR